MEVCLGGIIISYTELKKKSVYIYSLIDDLLL